MNRPARRIRKRKPIIRKGKPATSRIKLKIIFGVVLIFFFIILFFLAQPSDWNGKDRFVLTHPLKDGGVAVTIYEPAGKSITELIIPKNTVVTASRQMGEWQMGSVWQLGQNEKIGGSFLADSVTKAFKFPIDAWVGEIGWGLGSLSLKEQVQLTFFSMKARGNKVSIPLEETGYLTGARLKDGDEGYEIRDAIPVKLLRLFYLASFTAEASRVQIIDQTGQGGGARMIAETIEVLGGKVIRIQKEGESDFDCLVRAKDSRAADKIAHIFHCKRENKAPDSFSIEIKIGKEFSRRF